MSEKVKHGRPWDVNGRFETYNEATNRKTDLLVEGEDRYDIKIRRLSIGDGNHAFFVKTRLKEEYLNDGGGKNAGKRVRNKNKGTAKRKG